LSWLSCAARYAGRWVARGDGAAAHIDSSQGVVAASATALQSLAAGAATGWLWLDAAFESPKAACLDGWESPAALGCLTGRRVLFAGDSFVRNMFFGLMKLLEGRLNDPDFAYPKSAWMASAMERDSGGLGRGSEFTSKLFNGKLGRAGVVAATPPGLQAATQAGGGWVRYYSHAKTMEQLAVLQRQVETQQPDVVFAGIPSIHDHIRSGTDPVQLATQLGEWVRALKATSPAIRVIYLSINVQDASKKLRQYKQQGREWSIGFIRAVGETLKAMGVEVLDTSGFTDPKVHGNVISDDGTHAWGFVDVMKARLALAALCGEG
jgi:hypothetical protein